MAKQVIPGKIVSQILIRPKQGSVVRGFSQAGVESCAHGSLRHMFLNSPERILRGNGVEWGLRVKKLLEFVHI